MRYFITTVIIIIILAGIWYFFMGMDGQNSEEPLLPLDNIAEETSDDGPSVIEEEINYYGDVMGYLARPSEPGEYPGLVLIHEWWGLNQDIKDLADRFAEDGYVALAVDMYDGTVTSSPDMARSLATAVRDDIPEALQNLQAAVDYLKSREDVDPESLASVGWCFGGGWAYQMAVNDLDIDASVMYYGQFDPEEDFAQMKASILGHFGEEDSSISVDSVNEFQAALETANGMHQVYIYPNVGHGFANVREGDNLGYSEEAAELAWQRTQDFLKQVFGL